MGPSISISSGTDRSAHAPITLSGSVASLRLLRGGPVGNLRGGRGARRRVLVRAARGEGHVARLAPRVALGLKGAARREFLGQFGQCEKPVFQWGTMAFHLSGAEDLDDKFHQEVGPDDMQGEEQSEQPIENVVRGEHLNDLRCLNCRAAQF